MTSPRVDPAFGERLRRLRTSQGLTQRELAERSQISKRAVEEYERGLLPRKAIPALARTLGVSAHYLTHGVEPLEGRVDILTDRLEQLDARLAGVEKLIGDTALHTRRMYGSLDALVRLLIAEIAPELLAGLPFTPGGQVDDPPVAGEPDADAVEQ